MSRADPDSGLRGSQTRRRDWVVRCRAMRPSESRAGVRSIRARGVTANEPDALGDFGDVVIPVVLVFERDIAVEALAFQFVEDPGHIGDAGAEGHIVGVGSHAIEILQMTADEAAFKDLEAFHGVQIRAHPMAGIGAGANPAVPVSDQVGHVLRIPNLIVGIVGAHRMIMDRHLDVELLDEFLDRVEGVGRFRGDGADAQLAGELEDLPGTGFVAGDPDDAIIDGEQAVFGEFRFDLGDGVGGGGVIPVVSGSAGLSFWPG